MAFTVESSAFGDGGAIPREHTCEGSDLSPGLSWRDAPGGTKSYVLMVEDPDAPVGTFTHWVLYDLPGGIRGLPEGMSKDAEIENNAKQGITDFGRIGYWGPCPPKGHGRHRYFFILRALDVETLGLRGGAGRKAVERAMKGHVLGEATIMGTFER